ncbi:MAG: helix-turn-helix domain-containing protein [Tildeniella nuda ZEHNDER 1965/U140]|nr:helix-turn-helix domain-containing protein [Tildeniella nuda ZEHNDER 1965/U140]
MICKKQRDRKLPNQLGGNIAALRRYWCITQSDLADSVGLSRQQLGRVERGEAQLKAEYLPKLAIELRCLPEELTDQDYTEKN